MVSAEQGGTGVRDKRPDNVSRFLLGKGMSQSSPTMEAFCLVITKLSDEGRRTAGACKAVGFSSHAYTAVR